MAVSSSRCARMNRPLETSSVAASSASSGSGGRRIDSTQSAASQVPGADRHLHGAGPVDALADRVRGAEVAHRGGERRGQLRAAAWVEDRAASERDPLLAAGERPRHLRIEAGRRGQDARRARSRRTVRRARSRAASRRHRRGARTSVPGRTPRASPPPPRPRARAPARPLPGWRRARRGAPRASRAGETGAAAPGARRGSRALRTPARRAGDPRRARERRRRSRSQAPRTARRAAGQESRRRHARGEEPVVVDRAGSQASAPSKAPASRGRIARARPACRGRRRASAGGRRGREWELAFAFPPPGALLAQDPTGEGRSAGSGAGRARCTGPRQRARIRGLPATAVQRRGEAV